MRISENTSFYGIFLLLTALLIKGIVEESTNLLGKAGEGEDIYGSRSANHQPLGLAGRVRVRPGERGQQHAARPLLRGTGIRRRRGKPTPSGGHGRPNSPEP